MTVQTYPTSGTRRVRRWLGALWERPIARAIFRALLTIWVVITLTFLIVRLMPGNPVDIFINQLIAEQGISYAEAADQASGLFNLDLKAPLHEQYWDFLTRLVRGDLGASFLSAGTPVLSIIAAALPWTLFTVGTGLLLSAVTGILLGLLAAYRRDSKFDTVVSTVSSIISSLPDYLLALLIVVLLGTQLRLVPIAQMRGASSPGIAPGFTPDFIGDILFHAALPIAVFYLTGIGHWVLGMKSATMATLEEDYVNAARARGLRDSRIRTAYVGRNAVLPLVAQFALEAGRVVGGAIFVETILVYPGIGLRLIGAISQRDYPVMQGIVLVVTASVVVANLLSDIAYSRLDPRIGRAGGAAG